LICGVCGALLPGSALVAFGEPSISVIISDVGGQKKDIVPAVPDVFGNREEQVTLTIATTFEGSAYLRADLFQIAGKLSMPLASDVHLKEVTFLHVIAQNLTFQVRLPDVKRPTEILVRVSLVPKGTQDPALHVTDLLYKVFPASVTQELKDLLQPTPGNSAPVVLFGPGQSLRHFLAGVHVPFEDGGTGTPDRFDPNRLYFGELATEEQFQQAQDQSTGTRMALFSSDESLPAGVYAERSNSGVLIHVTSPLLDNLNDDPQHQLAFIKIIHFLSAPPPSAN
jgi:hypothetical protein